MQVSDCQRLRVGGGSGNKGVAKKTSWDDVAILSLWR